MRQNRLASLVRTAVHALRAPVDRFIARRTPPADLWRRRRASEVAFWDKWVRTQGAEWSTDEWKEHLTETSTLVGRIALLVEDLSTPTVSILDVGAGPATTLGKTHPEKRLEISAVDPLADEYQGMFRAAGITPPIVTLRCSGEKLLERFDQKSFDIAYARNSLDHAYDPVKVIDGMVRVARFFVLLEHERNEAEKERYHGMHNWNMDVDDDGRFVIWNLRERHDVGRSLGTQPKVEIDDEGWITVLFDLRTDLGGDERGER